MPVIDGQVLGCFTARIGSFSDYGDRWFANLIRKRALRRARRVLAA